MAVEIKLPALKENVDVVEVNAVRCAPGDTVNKDQVILEVQADKTALDVPSPTAGRITEVRVKPGDQIKVGQVICLIDGSGNGEVAKKPAPAKKAEPAPTPAPPTPKQETQSRPQPVAPPTKPVAGPPVPVVNRLAPAGPATRRLARELGIDLSQVPGSGQAGRVVEEDVKAYARQLASTNEAAPTSISLGVQAPPLPNFEEWGPIERQPLLAVRKATARQMSLAWSLIPHVTQHDLADITELDAFRKAQEGKGPKLTVTAFALKAVAVLLRQFPNFNATLDAANNQLILKRYYHVGVAVDTENGLLVPVIRDVDRKSVAELAEELAALADRARQRKLDGAELKGGTFTITNLGGIGGTGFTPIVNYPEVAILGLSRGRLEPVVRNSEITPRLMLPLSLSYDHRVIDGAAAARFTRRLAEMLENPLLMLLHA
ncbi:MAG TPA: 2-oxo acid dehydrogenase subunit E2 [Gemmataceae bacterium]|nr:2-oxo acid dehydrogenase subunit E2 [Gemmataceae bacterium]